MEQDFNKMSLKGQKGAIILVRTLLNNPQQFDYIKDTYLVKRHGSWQFRDKLSVMLDKGDDTMTSRQRRYLSKYDKKVSNNDKYYTILGIILVMTAVILGVWLGINLLMLQSSM